MMLDWDSVHFEIMAELFWESAIACAHSLNLTPPPAHCGAPLGGYEEVPVIRSWLGRRVPDPLVAPH